MIQNTTLITNSEYSRKAISYTYGIQDSIVLYPPADVEKFRRLISFNDNNYDDEKKKILSLLYQE